MQDLEFHFKPSRQYLIFLTIMGVMCGGIILTLPLLLWINLSLLACLFLYLGKIIWQFGLLRARRSIIHIRRHQDGTWQITTPEKNHTATLCGDSTVTRFISILRFRTPQRLWPQSCIIFRDSLGGDDYRKLLVMVRMG